MSTTNRLASFRWVFLLILACSFVCWTNLARIRRVEYVTGLVPSSAVVDSRSPTGYAGGLRQLIVPERNDASYQWIMQTQQMLARSEWRLRRVNYDNAPTGRETRESSPYRWCLGAVSWLEKTFDHVPTGVAVERAALHLDVLVQLGLLLSATLFAWKCFGSTEAIILSLGLGALFPFAGIFAAGQPDDKSLSAFLIVWSILPLIAGQRARAAAAVSPKIAVSSATWFKLGALAGALGIWVNPLVEAPILLGLGLGGMVQGRLAKRFEKEWSWWAWIGAAATFILYLAEFAPSHLVWSRLETIHPLYAVAWLGLGKLAALAHRDAVASTGPSRIWRKVLLPGLSVAALLALPSLLFIPRTGHVFIGELQATRLTRLPNSPEASNLFSWMARDGVNLTVFSTLWPLLLSAPLIALLLNNSRRASAVAVGALPILGAVLVALVLACSKLSWWNELDALLLLFAVAALANDSAPTAGFFRRKWLVVAATAVALLPGAMLVAKQGLAGRDTAVTETEIQSLVERDLAHWLANRVGPTGGVVLAPPEVTVSFIFHGGLRGLSTPYPENKDGFAAAVRIAGATSQDEALSIVERRQVTHIVVPTWDNALETFASLVSDKPEQSLISLLNRWAPPRWLRPVSFRVATIPGFESQRAAVFERVELQDNPLALARLEDYFIEMDAAEPATAVNRTLATQFPQDINSLIARAGFAVTTGNAAELQSVLGNLIPKLPAASAGLPLDRRVTLAVALADAKRYDLARVELENALQETDEAAIRGLTISQLYRMSAMMKVFGLSFSDLALRDISRALLPQEFREKL